ncbi:MAG: SDR family oxidoreductase [Bacteroidia bacterium]|nr:SDR family oxidoreductase [Bacteroidia bacterium]
MNPFSLQNKNIIITGASSGLGKACAILFSQLGATLVLVGRNEQRLIETKNEMDNRDNHLIMVTDLTKTDGLEKLINEASLKLGTFDGLVHCAGISTTLPLRLTHEEKLNYFFQTNVYSAIELCKILSKPKYINKNGGSFVLLSSVMGHVGEVGKTIYGLTKGALLAGAKSMAIELAPKKIRVNCISPGVIITPMTSAQPYNENENSLNIIKSYHPLGLGEPSDVANACAYFISDASKWVTGTNLMVDGGYTAR